MRGSVNSMEELYHFIEESDSYSFSPKSSTLWTEIDPTIGEKIDFDLGVLLSPSRLNDVLDSVHVPYASPCDDTKSSLGSIASRSPESDDEEAFDLAEWLIRDSSSCRTRSPKLYEFLRLLLDNKRYVSYASWLDIDQGSFKIHRPMDVASLWKRVKSRKATGSMDYDTFARGIRYYYKSGMMLRTHTRHTYCFAQL